MNTHFSRREFVKTTALGATAVAMSARSYSQVVGANDRVRVGLIGFGLVGRIHARNFHANKGSQLVAVSDTFQPRADACKELVGPDLKQYPDFRKLLDDKSIDAVCVATPDHWHALHAMLACAAGKDVYAEKPMHLFIKEGEWMQKVASKHNRVVQIGTQQRSAEHYHQAKDLLRNNAIGEIVSVQCNFFRNIMPGIGNPPDGNPPPELNWNMLLGPAPQRAYNPNRAIYHFRWFWDYSGGQMTNLGHHSLDVVHWIYDIKGPKAVSSSGGRFFLKDNGEVPDVQDAIIEYPETQFTKGFPAVVQFRECHAGPASTTMGSLTFMGTKGTMMLGRDGFQIIPDKKVNPINTFAKIIGGHPVGGPQPAPEAEDQLWTEAKQEKSPGYQAEYVEHVQNFLDCVRSRKTPNSDLASSHTVSTTCHLANISLRLGRKIKWDIAKQEIIGDSEANHWLRRPYRAPWDKELKALGVA
jgi:predicted dehydrogenase